VGVNAYKDKKGRTRYRVTFSRNGRRLVDERLPAGTSKEKAEQYNARITTEWFDSDRLGIQKIPLISTVIKEYQARVVPGLRSKYAMSNIRAVAPSVVGKTLDQLHLAADDLQKRLHGKAPATINCRLTFLKTLGKRAVQWKMVDRDYSVGIPAIQFNNARQHYISKAQLAEILRHAESEVRRAAWQLFYSGMRRGELYDCTIGRDTYKLPMTKNGDPRIVPIPEAVRRIVGKPKLHRDVLTAKFKEACQKAGYGHLRLHDLRHSAASQLLNAGADLGVVGFILGHRDPKSVRRYAHLATDTARQWINYAASGGRFTARGSQVVDSHRPQDRAPRTEWKKRA
jgi:integrase